MTKKLLVIIPDYLSVLIEKGEVVPRYYNPGNYFDEVHLLMTNDDQPDPKQVQVMVGKAKLYLHNHPQPANLFKRTLGWQPYFLKPWLEAAFQKIERIRPTIIRCHGMHLNLAIAVYAKKKLGIPLLVSLHTHPLLDSHKEKPNLKEKIIHYAALKFSRYLKHVDLILPVYLGIVDYIKGLGLNNYQLLYNQVGINPKNVKTKYDTVGHFKIICIGQQIPNKNPVNLIKAIAQFEEVKLDIVGVGRLNAKLKKLVDSLGLQQRVTFISSIKYTDLCNQLKQYDLFAACIDCIGISKTVIESLLVKLPVLLNINSHTQVPELNDSICLRVPNTVEGYKTGIRTLMENKKLRMELAENGYQYAWERWDPLLIEQRHIEIYKQYT